MAILSSGWSNTVAGALKELNQCKRSVFAFLYSPHCSLGCRGFSERIVLLVRNYERRLHSEVLRWFPASYDISPPLLERHIKLRPLIRCNRVKLDVVMAHEQ